MTTAKAAPKTTAKEQLQKAKPATPVTPKVETKVEVQKKATDQASQERAQRRILDGKDKTKDGVHPFGQRNRCLCEARKAYRAGDMSKGDKKAAEAGQFATLSLREKQQLAKTAKIGLAKLGSQT